MMNRPDEQARYQGRVVSYEEINPHDLIATDLREELAGPLASYPLGAEPIKAFRLRIEDAAGKPCPLAEALEVPHARRVGIAWGAEADWGDFTGDRMADYNAWLLDPDWPS